jgi:hypothetical protein
MFTFTPFKKIDGNGYLQNSYLEEVIRYHETEWTFSKRILFTQILTGISRVFSISRSYSFVILNSLLLFLGGYLIGIAGYLKTFSRSTALISQTLFFSLFSIVFVFFAPVYTYEDLLQIVLLLSCSILLNEKKIAFASIFLILAVLTRETSIIVIPLLWSLHSVSFQQKMLMLFVAVMPVLGLFVLSDFEVIYYVESRLNYIHFNFQNASYVLESLLSTATALCFPLIFNQMKWKNDNLKQIFWITFVVNMFFVFFFAHAREARLFFLPVYLMIPEFATSNLITFKNFKLSNFLCRKEFIVSISVFTSILAFVFYAIHFFYKPTIAVTTEICMESYFSLCITLIFYFSIFKKLRNIH